jgi:membrane-associated phospholipid phosphatase
MKESTYIQITSALHANPALERSVNMANRLITNAIYIAYPCLIVWLFIAGGWPSAILNGDWSAFAVPAVSGSATAELAGESTSAAVSGVGLLGFANAQAATPIEGHIALLYALLVPGISFVLVSVFRRIVNAPRPYEVFDGVPVIAKDTLGKSFPSRHAFSIFIIGMAFCACCPLAWAGPVILVLGVALAVIRVIAGVHFPRDVIAGALAGILLGYVGFWLI